jgi:ribosomal protein S18 acetylase RimI-like enzyme
MTIHIRPATRDDIQYLADIERSAAQAFRILPDYVDNTHTVPTELLVGMAETGKIWVAVADQKPVGFIACGEMDGFLYVHEMSVAFEHQKQGIGRNLMLKVLDEAAKANYPGISLTTRRHAAWNMPFYKKLGFIEAENAQELPGLFAQLQKEINSGTASLERCAMIIKLKE